MLLIATDLPVPVAPAISRWGILARSAITGLPSRSRPSTTGRMAFDRSHSSASSISRSVTIRGDGFGTSTPTAPRPGMGATRMLKARIVMARSSASAMMRPAFTPGAGTTSNWVTTGPLVRPAIVPSTLNVRSVSISNWPSLSSAASSAVVSWVGGRSSSSTGGSSFSSPVGNTTATAAAAALVTFAAGFFFSGLASTTSSSSATGVGTGLATRFCRGGTFGGAGWSTFSSRRSGCHARVRMVTAETDKNASNKPPVFPISPVAP